MKTLLIYGYKWGWINFESNRLLPYFRNGIQQILIFTKPEDLKLYIKNNPFQQNYILPLDESHMMELEVEKIPGLYPPSNIVDTFCNKQKFSAYVMQNNLSHYFPITYTSVSNSNQTVIVKPKYGGCSVNVYITTLDKITPDIFTNNIVQEYINSKIEFAGYFVAKDGKIVHSFAYYRTYTSVPYIKGINDNTVQYKTKINENYIKIIEKFISPVSFTGTFCVDFKLAKNTLIVLEINARLGGSLSYPNNSQDAVDIISKMMDVF